MERRNKETFEFRVPNCPRRGGQRGSERISGHSVSAPASWSAGGGAERSRRFRTQAIERATLMCDSPMPFTFESGGKPPAFQDAIAGHWRGSLQRGSSQDRRASPYRYLVSAILTGKIVPGWNCMSHFHWETSVPEPFSTNVYIVTAVEPSG